MRVLLVSTNRELLPTPVPPLGLAWIGAVLREAGHRPALCDLAFTSTVDEAREMISASAKAFRPDAVAVGIRNLDNAIALDSHSYLQEIRTLVGAIRAAIDVPMVVGGPALTVAPRLLLEALDVPYGVVGEGEAALPLLLEQLEAGREPRSVPGLARRDDPGSGPIPAARVPDLDALPLPAHDLIDWDLYRANGADAGVQTKRGCAFRCTYCNYPALEGRTYRLRDPERVADELELLVRRHRMPFVFFVDSVFSTPAPHAAAVCDAIVRRGLPVRWNAYVNPTGMTRELVARFKAAGCHGVELTADGATPETLAALQKGFGLRALRRSTRELAAAGIPYALFLLLGLPGETRETVRRGLAEVARLPGARAVLLNVGARVYDQTPLSTRLRAAGGSGGRDPWYHIEEDLAHGLLPYLDSLAARHPGWTTPTDWAQMDRRFFLRIAQRIGIRPIWRLAPLYGLLRPAGRLLGLFRSGAARSSAAEPVAALPA